MLMAVSNTTLDLLSRLKGIETQDDIHSDTNEKEIFGSAFPFEGN